MSILRELLLETGLGVYDFQRLVETAPKRYKSYEIPKRHGGTREIAQPSPEVKTIQRALVAILAEKYPVHNRAMAYVRGRGIADNAEEHKNSSVILKLDFQAFFHSILPKDWQAYVKRSEKDPALRKELIYLTPVLFWGRGTFQPKCLSIGAPSSPFLSNAIMYRIDQSIAGNAAEFGVRFTRYADDITLSGDNLGALLKCEKQIRSLLARTKSPKLIFNDSKRGIYTKGQRRLVTGLIITPEGDVSIGRDRKRKVSSMLHKFTIGELSKDDTFKLKGFLAFAWACEPEFLERMRNKYGEQALREVQAYGPPDSSEI